MCCFCLLFTHITFGRKEEEGGEGKSSRYESVCVMALRDRPARIHNCTCPYQTTTHQNWSICTLQGEDSLNSASALFCPGIWKQKANRDAFAFTTLSPILLSEYAGVCGTVHSCHNTTTTDGMSMTQPYWKVNKSSLKRKERKKNVGNQREMSIIQSWARLDDRTKIKSALILSRAIAIVIGSCRQ